MAWIEQLEAVIAEEYAYVAERLPVADLGPRGFRARWLAGAADELEPVLRDPGATLREPFEGLLTRFLAERVHGPVAGGAAAARQDGARMVAERLAGMAAATGAGRHRGPMPAHRGM
jgi:hypothetical protein